MASQKNGQICGDRVRELCKAEKIKQKDLAEKLYITESGLGKIISGKRRLKKDLAEKINQLYPDYSVDWLLGKTGFQNRGVELSHLCFELEREENCFCTYLSNNGFRVIDAAEECQSLSMMEHSEFQKLYDFGYMIVRKNDNASIRLSRPEMMQLKKHINSMVALHLDYLFNTKEHLPK